MSRNKPAPTSPSPTYPGLLLPEGPRYLRKKVSPEDRAGKPKLLSPMLRYG